MHTERHPVQRLTFPTLIAALLISLVPLEGALAQQVQMPPGVGDAPHGAPVLVLSGSQTAPLAASEHFAQLLLIVDFPAGAWTPIHTNGGFVSTKVIEGAISTRMPSSEGDREATFEAGDTFLSTPGVYLQVGNASANGARIITTAWLRNGAPLTIYQDGYTSNAYPSLTDWNWTHDLVVPALGPTTAHRAAIEVNGLPRPLDDGGRAFDAYGGYAVPAILPGGTFYTTPASCSVPATDGKACIS